VRIVVVGAGVIGLTCAHRLVRAGHAVEVWSRDAIQDTTSTVAAAIWFPHLATPREQVLGWAAATYDMLSILAVRPETAVTLRRGRQLYRGELEIDPWWAAAVPRLRRLPDGYEFAAPIVRMPAYLAWLVDELAAAGVALRHREVTDLAAVDADVVVNATGLGARSLVGDTQMTPVRGQVVRVADPGLTAWTRVIDHPGGHLYVVPRGTDVVLGGTDDVGFEAGPPDPAVAAAIVARCTEVVPELRGAPVLSHAVGARPVRTGVRLEREGNVVHCYGHGGAGVTLSWGCADEVVRLVASA
jgi:D-amino-acid oxidase